MRSGLLALVMIVGVLAGCASDRPSGVVAGTNHGGKAVLTFDW